MASKLKVLQVIPRLGYGGAETGCYDLAHYLYEQKCKSYIVTSGGELLEYIDKKKVKLIKLPVHTKNPILIIINSIILAVLILFLNISIVHARSRAPAWSCYIATKLTARKFVTTFHGTYNFKSSIKKFYNSIMVKSDLLIAGSNFIFSHISENYKRFLNSKKKFLVIFRGINTEYFDADTIKLKNVEKLKNSWKIEENKKIILLPGRLTAWKGQEMFIEAINLFQLKNPELDYVAVILGNDQGRTVYRKKLERLVQQFNLTQKIKFVDNCRDMPLAYHISDVIVSSSIEPEAFGRVSVEAQAMKKPIIASNIGGSKETVIDNKTGLLFDSGNPKSLCDKLDEIIKLDSLTLDLMGREGRKNVINRFNIDKMCLNTYSEYKKLIN
ncbi:glycosyltransferase family 4 protein [Pelagibacterales bacterium SAG-MED15]|jgi:glycosyltransferase involved in cell wall biosynthesis|nr:glycosyltransferase family 4 protein [Pelagibacterales bacterium SAG-MED15]RZO50260.1 MAG: glycosyltransferase [Pelagibacterales bacterium]|tara:strand:+ start:784 stop:1938 length:1155 start_codon:yes stop_codon:yes gene_type:complete